MRIGLLAAAAVLALSATVARAEEVLTYAGLPMTSGPFAGSSLDAVIDVPVSSTFSGQVSYYTGDLSYFSMTATGAFTITNSDPTVFYDFQITFENGLPVDWAVASNTNGPGPFQELYTIWDPDKTYFTADGGEGDIIQVGDAMSTTTGFPNAPATGTWAISAAPEPATWLLMLTGLGSVGLALRRRPLELQDDQHRVRSV